VRKIREGAKSNLMQGVYGKEDPMRGRGGRGEREQHSKQDQI
jgi:hypothetical protein